MVKHGNKSCFWIFKLQLHSAGYSDTDYPVISYLLELERMSRSKRSEHSTKVLRVGTDGADDSGHTWTLKIWGWAIWVIWVLSENEIWSVGDGEGGWPDALVCVHLVTLSSETWLCSLIRLFTRRGTRLVVVLRPPGAHQNLPPSTHQSSIISGITTITILSQKSF